LGLSGQKLLGVPVVIQPSQAEKNRVGNYSDPMVRPEKGPMKLYIGSLHFNITEDMLKGNQNTKLLFVFINCLLFKHGFFLSGPQFFKQKGC
jgi:hypothetical protein